MIALLIAGRHPAVVVRGAPKPAAAAAAAAAAKRRAAAAAAKHRKRHAAHAHDHDRRRAAKPARAAAAAAAAPAACAARAPLAAAAAAAHAAKHAREEQVVDAQPHLREDVKDVQVAEVDVVEVVVRRLGAGQPRVRRADLLEARRRGAVAGVLVGVPVSAGRVGRQGMGKGRRKRAGRAC